MVILVHFRGSVKDHFLSIHRCPWLNHLLDKNGASNFFFLKGDFRDVGGQFYQTCPSSSRAKGEGAPRCPD